MKFQGFIGPSYKLRAVGFENQRSVNLYAEIDELGTGKEGSVAYLMRRGGLRRKANLGAGAIRGQWMSSVGRYFVVRKNVLYEVDKEFNETEIGILEDNNLGPISMSDNGFDLVLVDNPKGYTFKFEDNTFSRITSDQFSPAAQVVYQDGRFIFIEPDSKYGFVSGIDNVTFDVLLRFPVEGSSDNLVAVISDHRDLWFFKETTTEVFYNAGDPDQPFQRNTGAFIEHGCAAAFSPAKINNTVFWLARDDKGQGVVYMAQGFTPQKVSTLAVDAAIQSYGDISDARAYTYQYKGHFFYVLNFTSANTTWVFDTTTGLWHEETYFHNGLHYRHRGDNYAFAFGKHIVGDHENGNLYEIDDDYHSDDGAKIRWMRVSPHISKNLKTNFHHSFELDIERGVGISGTGPDSDPEVYLRYSNDGGRTWSNERKAKMGKMGEYKTRAIFERLGSARDRVYEVSGVGEVKTALLNAELRITEGAH